MAIPELSVYIRTYAAQMAQGQGLVERRIRYAENAAEQAIRAAQRALSAANDALSACQQQEDADCNWAAAQVARARDHLEAMYAIAADIRFARDAYVPASRRFSQALDVLGQQVQSELKRAGDTLDVYFGGTGGSGGGGSAVRASGSTTAMGAITRPAGFPEGFAMVPLSLVDESDSQVGGPEDFKKGYSPADLEWAHEAFVGVIMPGVANGLTIDDFRDRDQREGRMGTRSYADTYSGFFSTDHAITLSGPGCTVVNGYHRIWVARQMGLRHIPARLMGGS
ncbi:MAG: hypothetical protein ACOYLK_17910 [Sphingomonas sp.]